MLIVLPLLPVEQDGVVPSISSGYKQMLLIINLPIYFLSNIPKRGQNKPYFRPCFEYRKTNVLACKVSEAFCITKHDQFGHLVFKPSTKWELGDSCSAIWTWCSLRFLYPGFMLWFSFKHEENRFVWNLSLAIVFSYSLTSGQPQTTGLFLWPPCPPQTWLGVSFRGLGVPVLPPWRSVQYPS